MTDTDRSAATRSFGASVDFGRTARAYGQHRPGFPPLFFDQLAAHGLLRLAAQAADIGTGTGTIARGLAGRGLRVTGIDPAAPLLAEAARLAEAQGVTVAWTEGTAEDLSFPDTSLDLVTAGQCWHWFDRPRAASEAARALRPGGTLVIAHLDWLPLPGSIVAATEALILRANPDWAPMAGGTGLYPAWLADLAHAGFTDIASRSTDVTLPFSHAAWCGRIRASAGVGASLPAAQADAVIAELADLLARDAPDQPLAIPHRLWWTAGRKPA